MSSIWFEIGITTAAGCVFLSIVANCTGFVKDNLQFSIKTGLQFYGESCIIECIRRFLTDGVTERRCLQSQRPIWERKRYMKKIYRHAAGLLCGLGLLTCAGMGTITASATTVGDVIAHAYAVGLPEAQIQQAINMYSGGDYTSEQCDKAIAALDSWAAERDAQIQDQLDKATTASQQDSSGSVQTTTTAVTKKPSKQDFIDMSIDEKTSYINSLPADERTDFINNMGNDERNSFLKQMDTDKQAAVIASMMGMGDAFGVTFSVDELSGGSAAISARDADGNLIGVTTFGDTVEKTGVPYTVPVLIGGGSILLAAAGMGVVVLRSSRKK